MTQYRVVIPDEKFAMLEWVDEGLPAICAVNQSLANFDSKIVFGWHLSIIVECAQLAGKGMPTSDEKAVIDNIGRHFDLHLKTDGNALFLARITWNGTRQFLYRVYDPEMANAFLTEIVDNGREVRPLDFKMEHDPDWNLANWYLKNWEK